MTEAQLNNLVNFSFHFHEQMGMDVLGCSACYIHEKWDKYIGVKPIDDKSLKISTLNKIKVNKLSHHYSRIMTEWRKKWSWDDSEYNDVKEKLYFICAINSKAYRDWTPSKLIKKIEECIGDSEKINADSYNNLHELIKRAVVVWQKVPAVSRSYTLLLLNNKLNS